jgi:UDPglucose 6-dehydrogenase
MKIAIIGTGYVGLVTAVGFAEVGNKVICVDIVKEKTEMINSGKSPIYEENLEDMLKRNIGKNLRATTDLKGAVKDSEITFVCVGTPSKEDGSFDLTYIKNASEDIGRALSKKKEYHVVVYKSTVMPGTTSEKLIPILEKASGKKAYRDFGVATNPEFLRESIAVEDFMKPDRIIIGATDDRTGEKVAGLYAAFGQPVMKTDLSTAEMIKYASNAFLAAKISFINEIGNICKKKGIDTYDVSKGMGLDHRISPHFLSAGLGWGGSCFPKDLRALIHESRRIGYEPKLLDAVNEINEKQPYMLLSIAKRKAGSLKNKKVAVMGLAFKGGTDDTRDSQAFPVIEGLLQEGSSVVAYDPKAKENARKVLGDRIQYSDSAQKALKDADLCLILTDWKDFSDLDFSSMKKKTVIDARNILKKRGDLDYEGLCW